MTQANQFGRVDENNNVYVVDQGVERHIGQYLGVSADDAMAFYVRKFDDLEAQVRILEQRIASNSSNPKSLVASFTKLQDDLVQPQAVGDLGALRARVAKLAEKVSVVSEQASKEQEAAIEAALNARAAIAAQAEELIAKIPNLNWKKTSEEMNALFLRWQELQKSGARVPKSKADPIWKRFSQARSKFEQGKRAFFASLDGKSKEAKSAKQQLVEQAEALVSKGADAAADYRRLLDAWKSAPRAGKSEDAFWERFKKAGDSIYSAKKAKDQELDVEHQGNLKLKLALLAEAEAVSVDDLDSARAALSGIRAKWSEIGHVPKNDVRSLEDRLRKVEQKIRAAEEERWRRSDPAAKDRSNSLVSQLEAVIANLELDLAAASATKKKDIQAQIDSRKALLLAAKSAVD